MGNIIKPIKTNKNHNKTKKNEKKNMVFMFLSIFDEKTCFFRFFLKNPKKTPTLVINNNTFTKTIIPEQ